MKNIFLGFAAVGVIYLLWDKYQHSKKCKCQDKTVAASPGAITQEKELPQLAVQPTMNADGWSYQKNVG